MAATRVDGRRFLKLTLLNPAATPADVLAVVDDVRRTGRRLATAAAPGAPRDLAVAR